MVTDISDGICAYLQGGFGNQLFILAAAWQQAERLQCPLYIDASRFSASDPLEFIKDTPRDFDLGVLALPGTVLVEDSPWYRSSPRRPKVLRKTAKGVYGLTVYRQPVFGFDERVNDVTVGTTMFGFFQSARYFEQIAGKVRWMLEAAAISTTERTTIDALAADPRITVHLRRGDYLQQKTTAYHGIATAAYFGRALGVFETLYPSRGTRIFSDSPEIARAEMASASDATFFDAIDPSSSVATVLAMAAGNGFAMSNSSFSWWAAWLMVQRADSYVIAPRPWQSGTKEDAIDLLMPTWLTLDAR
jgi:hypothetical protein